MEHVTHRCSESVKAEHFIIFFKLQIQNFSIQSKRNKEDNRKNHAVLRMAKKAVIRRDLQ